MMSNTQMTRVPRRLVAPPAPQLLRTARRQASLLAFAGLEASLSGDVDRGTLGRGRVCVCFVF